ncbi:MAG: RnfH family protein [Gammaproteobacteria bacterium]|nr:RnfH family protein [Gammaproteobacteria bacterium]NBT44923.1 RnfH family protein [Gammaproteobacteria bacterium]NBY23551.1 RnfH family protein [Gammaproteobacteria bacterium]NDE34610.1 RnfH family protein [Gammaproteobacteria bacterium]NDE56686.1 RnfH family protein [Gammaproteobacteria bacterium]
MDDRLIEVEVAYARPERQVIVRIKMTTPATIEQAIKASGILDQFPEIDPLIGVGLFGHQLPLETQLQGGDRVEIYRPLMIDPREARRARALRK